MILNKETIYKKDLENKKIKVIREFDAPNDLVWKAWTERDLLDQWWAPRPWKAITQSIDFREGGRWLYYMEGPDGTRHYCCVDYHTIQPKKSFSGLDAFCDENGNVKEDFPQMLWHLTFLPGGETTTVEVNISFNTVEDLDKTVEMGFQEGFAAAHNNLDELLSSLR